MKRNAPSDAKPYLDDLRRLIQKAWSRETSADPENWSPKNRAWGQCAVTALVVQDYCGGELLRVNAHVPEDDAAISHYYNRLPDGTETDFTRTQFPPGTDFSEPAVREREYVVSFPATVRRYKTLIANIANVQKRKII